MEHEARRGSPGSSFMTVPACVLGVAARLISQKMKKKKKNASPKKALQRKPKTSEMRPASLLEATSPGRGPGRQSSSAGLCEQSLQ